MSEPRSQPVVVRLVMAVVLAIGPALLLVRDVHTRDHAYDFLVWNVFLAWIPYALAVLVRAGRGRRVSRYALAAAGGMWLLFLPNAFYIVTDFVHLNDIHGMPVWFDAVMVGSFACTGLLLGFASLRIMEQLARGLGAPAGWVLTLGALALAGVGIYLGRALQFNSWDVIVRPGHLAAPLLATLADPASHSRALLTAVGIGTVLALAYLAIRWCLVHGRSAAVGLRAHSHRRGRL